MSDDARRDLTAIDRGSALRGSLSSLRSASEFDLLRETVVEHARGEPVLYVPNVGNWGDALIHRAVLQFLEFYEIDHVVSWAKFLPDLATNHPRLDPSRSLVLVSGCGAWGQNWSHAREVVSKVAPDFRQTIVLPTTFEIGPVDPCSENDVLYFCRDRTLSKSSIPDAVFCHDMAFFLEMDLDVPVPGDVRRSYFRGDKEASSLQDPSVIDSGSYDLSALGKAGDRVETMLKIIAGSTRLRTDRMHVAIAGAMLGLDVELFGGNYPKGRAVFEASLRPHYPNASFVEWRTGQP